MTREEIIRKHDELHRQHKEKQLKQRLKGIKGKTAEPKTNDS